MYYLLIMRQVICCIRKQGIAPGGGETICPPAAADGSSTVAKVAVDLRPSADGSTVRTSLVANDG